MQTTVNERIKEIAEKLYNGNITAMAKATFISRTTINSIIGEKEVAPGYDVIRKIAEISSPKINLDWLIIGTGEMFIDTPEKSISVAQNNNNSNIGSKINDSAVIIRLLAQLEEKDKQIATRDNQITSLIEILKSK
ncbi:hypothetical protein [uncultured Bacteroides sp.]|uniref:hypothetical protein n=1 Tax=uncultured Bacteroides sp. TaxID=162156 RepID=UPI0025D7EABF|nr:hypothetical protein [uncultured Bacteroides sp.]